MKILVVGDSHNNHDRIGSLLAHAGTGFDCFVHVGDGYEDLLRYENDYEGRFVAVKGNCDVSVPGRNINGEEPVILGGKAVFITHGHAFRVKGGTEALEAAASAKQAEICLFGHTHEACVFRVGKTLFMNPGSITLPRNSPVPTYGVITVEGNEVRAAVMGIFGKGLYKHIY